MKIQLPMKKWGSKEVVDWGKVNKGDEFLVDTNLTIVIDNNYQEVKTSKTGKTYKTRRLNVHLKGYDTVIEVGTDSLKNLSFMKKLIKMSKFAKKQETSYLPMIYQDGVEKNLFGDFFGYVWFNIMAEFEHCKNKKQISRVYGKYMRYLHPDKVIDDRYGCKKAIEHLSDLKGLYKEDVEERTQELENDVNDIMSFMRNLFN